ncbi:MAG: PAS domain S-box protein [Nitrospirae bacterium]|nr:PAS domain S-box protein [Nitrospirota bacterium]
MEHQDKAVKDQIDEMIKQGILEVIGDAVSIQGTDFRVLYQNQAHRKLIGDHLGEYCYKVYECRDEVCEGCPVDMAFKDGMSHTTERSAATERGILHVEITASPIRDSSGKIIAGIEVARDITEHKRTDELLKRAATEWQHTFDSISDFVSVHDKDFRCTKVNKALADFKGIKPEDLVGEHCYKIFHGTQGKWPECPLDKMLKSKRTETVEIDDPHIGRPLLVTVSPILDDKGEVTGGVHIARDITEQKKMEKRLKVMDWAIKSSTNAMVLADLEANLTYVNPVFLKLWGYESEDEVLGMHCTKFWQVKDKSTEIVEALRNKGEWAGERGALRKDGSAFIVELSANMVRDDEGKPICMMASLVDITEKKKLEEQLRQAQKMEAVGQLAGGVAHDFNNILSAIIGYGHVTLLKMANDDPLRLNIEHMLEATDKASYLTQSLLAFSRKQITDKKPVGLNGIIKRVEKFLLRIMGEDIKVRTMLSEEALKVLADSGQLEQVLINLATNARDALPKGGTFTIATEKSRIDNEFIRAHGYGSPGRYALITVTDNGTGMNENTKQKIFEPFFTTKEPGKGTGLGLSIVYGIIKQHEGYINVYSEPGAGTIFRIYLPLIAEDIQSEGMTSKTEYPQRGSEVILLAEDDESLRQLTKSVLDEFGYKVIEAADGEDAVSKFLEHKDIIELFLSDLIMPKKSGKAAFDEIRKIKSGIRAIFISGYTADIIQQKGLLEKEMTLIFKPVSPIDLLKKIREELDKK